MKLGPLFFAQPKVGTYFPKTAPTEQQLKERELKLRQQIELAFKMAKKPGKGA